jgi:HlyD family secretion protein
MEQSNRQVQEDLQLLRIDRQQVSRQKRGKRKWLLVLGIILVLSIVGVLIGMRLELGSQLGLVAKPVRVAVAARRNSTGPQPVLSASGYIIARAQVEVASKITGRVISLQVREGDHVRQGQVIARLDNLEVSAQVRQADANLAAAKARLAELEAGSRPQEIERAKAHMERAKADLNNAAVNLHRTEQLVKKGVLQQQALDDARARFEMTGKAHQAAQEDYELARLGPRQEAIDLARAQVRQAEAELAYAQAQLENTIIRAPVSGTVLDRFVDLGEMVTTGFTSERGARQALISIADVSDLQVELDITEADIARVELNQPTVITPDAYQDRHYQGIVEYIAAVANRQRATIQTKVKVLTPDRFLRPDMGARVTFYQKGADVPQPSARVMVPTAAVINQGGRAVVFLIKDQKAAMQPVTTGRQEAGYVEILTGLRGGESVIIDGQAGLKDGDKIAVPSSER